MKSKSRVALSSLAVLVVCLSAATIAMTRQWDKPLLDMHSFRQTQTAMSAYYMAKDPCMFFNYITPVLGKPWQIPMEVPFYQWLVARWHNLTTMGLDQSGKLVSIAFWLACLWPIWRLLSLLAFSLPQRCMAGVVIYSSPLYLYWGRAFMIETTGLFFSLGMVACVFAGYKQRSWRWVFAGLIFGICAALCKVTTWAIASGVAGLLILFSEGLPKRRDWGWIAGSCAAAVLPLLPCKLWLAYGDSVKQLNPFARELIISASKNQSAWNFGTIQQKLDPATWEHIWRHMTDQLLVPFPVIGPWMMPIVLIAGAIASPKKVHLILIFLAGFASGPLIFTNLYFEHSYYWCANGIWLLLAVGTSIAGLEECRSGRILLQAAAASLSVAIAITGFVAWSQRFLPMMQALPARQQFDEAWCKPIQKFVPKQRTVLIVGNDWNPNSLYYAERKGVAFPIFRTIRFPGPQLNESLAKLDFDELLGAVVINERLLTADNQAGVSAILEKLDMSRQGTRTPFGILFPALDLKFGELEIEKNKRK